MQASVPELASVEDGSFEPTVENHAALLGDPRLTHPANAGKKSQILNSLQQRYGNVYVQRLVGEVRGARGEAPGVKSSTLNVPQRVSREIQAERTPSASQGAATSVRKNISERRLLEVPVRTGSIVVQRTLAQIVAKQRRMGIAPGHSIRRLPANPDERQEGALYYDPDDRNLYAMCKREVVPRATTEVPGRRRAFITGYDRWRIYFVFGEPANQSTDEEFLAMYRHERIHQRQYQSLRQVDRNTARRNQELLDARGPYGAMVPARHNAQLDAFEHDPTQQAERVRQYTGGVDLTNTANREVQAHVGAFVQMFRRSPAAALNQIGQCLVPIRVRPGAPEILWSWDDADRAVREQGVNDIINSMRTPRDVEIMNTQILPGLRRALGARRPEDTPTGFFRHLTTSCPMDDRGNFTPDLEDVELQIARPLPRRGGGG